MSRRNWRFRLDDIVDALDAISEYVENIFTQTGYGTRKLLMQLFAT